MSIFLNLSMDIHLLKYKKTHVYQCSNTCMYRHFSFFDIRRVAKSSYNVSDFRWSYKRNRRGGGGVMRLGVPNSWGNLAPTRTPRPANHIRRKTPCLLNSHPHPNTTNLWQRCTRTQLLITSPPLLQVSWCQVLFCHLQVVERSDKIYHVKV